MTWRCPKGCKIEHVERTEYFQTGELFSTDINDQNFNNATYVDDIDGSRDFIEAGDPYCPKCNGQVVWTEAEWGKKDDRITI